MTYRIDDASQIQTLETIRRVILDRRLPSKNEAEYLLANIAALSDRVRRSQEASARRERERQVRDFDDVMGGGQ